MGGDLGSFRDFPFLHIITYIGWTDIDPVPVCFAIDVYTEREHSNIILIFVSLGNVGGAVCYNFYHLSHLKSKFVIN